MYHRHFIPIHVPQWTHDQPELTFQQITNRRAKIALLVVAVARPKHPEFGPETAKIHPLLTVFLA